MVMLNTIVAYRQNAVTKGKILLSYCGENLLLVQKTLQLHYMHPFLRYLFIWEAKCLAISKYYEHGRCLLTFVNVSEVIDSRII